MIRQAVTLVSVNVGPVTLLGTRRGHEVYSGIVKHPVLRGTTLHLGREGLDGDQQADQRVISGKRVHGGLQKAVYAYPADHYRSWSQELGVALAPGGFGENLTVGLTEDEVVIGEVLEWGSTILEVTGPRRPCYKLDMLRGPGTAAAMMANGRCGWYLKVRHSGMVSPADPLQVVYRPRDGVTVQKAFRQKVQDDPTVPDMPEG